MVRRFRPLVLIYETVEHGLIDDTTKTSYEPVMAHVTEVNGAQRQNNLFGKQYAMTWVARIRGNYKPQYVAFPRVGASNDQLTKYQVIQVRKHATRTDVYFANDREVTADELEQ